MSVPVAGLSPKVLRWARIRAGLSVETVAARMKRSGAEIEEWERGDAAPTYPQLEELARRYHRPIALFFFPEPPKETPPQDSFRTLPEFEIEELAPHTLLQIRHARALQLSLYELNGGVNPSPKKILRETRISPAPPIAAVAGRVREVLGIDLDVERRKWKSADEALEGWRRAFEDSGVFVFKNSFEQSSVSGFCLHDAEFPIIYVNNSTAATRQIFTLFHELGHLLSGTGGITKTDDSFIRALRGEDRQIEVFCNAFAAECILPLASFRAQSSGMKATQHSFEVLARAFKVSREVVARRFLDQKRLSQVAYERLVARWHQEYEESRERGGSGGNFYNTHIAYLGERYLRLAFGRYYEGAISREDLGGYLNMKAKTVSGLEDALVSRVTT
jgi:Zn-dependent peptidase ImmA (M78 family)